MRLDCSSAVLRALAVAHQAVALQGDGIAPRALLAALLQDPDGAPALLAASCGLIHGQWEGGVPTGKANELSIPVISDLAPPLRHLARLAGILFREAFQEGELTTNYLLLAVLTRHADLADELAAAGMVLAELKDRLGPPTTTVIPVPEDFGSPSGTPAQALEQANSLTEPIQVARLIDACANRAREGLRVAEDHARFVRNSPVLTAELKAIRHELNKALALLPKTWRSPLARNIEGDVGRDIRAAGEMERIQTDDIAQFNLKRAQEALRSLEEHAKLASSDAALAMMRLRYRAYALESLLAIPVLASSRLASARLYFLVTAQACILGLERTVKDAMAGGVTLIQSREKNMQDRDWLRTLESLRRWTSDGNALLVVNDRPDLAVLVEADGVHLGQEDMGVRQARQIVGHQRIVGQSTHTTAQFRQAVMDGADYAGVGPVFYSNTKEFSGLAGLEYVGEVAGMGGTFPWFALGGIHAGTVEAAMGAGARRVAVSNALASSPRPSETAAQLLRTLGQGN